jgi:DNA-directed RNA polymerase specialized sigma subunit
MIGAKQKGSCEFYSSYLQNVEFNGVKLREYITDKQQVADSLHEWVTAYVESNDPTYKSVLSTNILANTFYLILHELKSWHLVGTLFEEAVQNACIAVVAALDKFKPEREVKFTTYLMQCHIIKTAIRTTLAENSVVRIPNGVRRINKQKAKDLLRVKEEDTSTPETPAAAFISFEKDCTKKAKDTSSEFDNVVESEYIEEVDYNRYGGDTPMFDVENEIFVHQVKQMCELALTNDIAGLTPNEKTTLKHKYGLLNANTLKNKDIVRVLRAEGTEVSEPRVCQYHNNGLRKLRKFFKNVNDPQFVKSYLEYS